MILEKTPITLSEVKEIVKDLEEKQVLKDYLKKFTKLSKDKVVKLKEDLRKLNNLKIKEENIVKIVDFMPKDAEDINKIFTEVTLTEAEINAILEVVKKY